MEKEPLIHRVYAKIFRIWRQRRYKIFLDRVVAPAGGQVSTLLDVGGYPSYWTSNEPVAEKLDCLNIHEIAWDGSSAPRHKINTIVGDGCSMSQFGDGQYSIVFSNSVIEHVGCWHKQVAFAQEVRRVGQKLWIQTPAYECPIEPHYMAPIVHYLPPGVQRRILRWLTPWGWLARPSKMQVDEMVQTTRLLRRSEMIKLFPDCEIYTERMLGIIPKSYIAVRR